MPSLLRVASFLPDYRRCLRLLSVEAATGLSEAGPGDTAARYGTLAANASDDVSDGAADAGVVAGGSETRIALRDLLRQIARKENLFDPY